MTRSILTLSISLILLAACAPSSRNSMNHSKDDTQKISGLQKANEKATINPDDFILDKKPVSLLELPQTNEGQIVLADGFYETDYKSYCLQPGTPDPSQRDAYLQAPLNGYRKDIIETILRNSQRKSHLEQKNIQLLLWSVVSGSNYSQLSFPVRSTANELLSPQQIFELKGGAMAVVRTIAAAIPESRGIAGYGNVKQLFELGTSSYEAFEKIAVQRELSVIHRPDYKRDQWYKQAGGYYVRYFPTSYKNVKIQVFVPEGTVDTAAATNGRYLFFDPVKMMAVPANSNAQRLGIGAPMVDVIIKVIQINKGTGVGPGPKPPVSPKNPKGVS